MRTFFDFEFIEDGNAFVMEPISIGMVREDGEEYYAEFSKVPWDKANSWVLQNVRPYLTGPLKSRITITEEIRKFVGEKPEFWAYFADYDWVLLCQLFGRMIDLPDDWPKYCLDIKQLMWHANLHRAELDHLDVGVRHNALDDAKWNRDAFNYISDELQRSRLHLVRPGQRNRRRNLGR